jgi:GNAT superfamily N-acetyltransferase
MPEPFTIRPIQMHEVDQARRLIYGVAREQFHPELTLAQATAFWDARGVLEDMQDILKNYLENSGVFLVTVVDRELVGTGAFYRRTQELCELKRLYLLPPYQGRGLGYAMLMELIRRARVLGYHKMRLLTDRYRQARAVALYHRVGFKDIPNPNAASDCGTSSIPSGTGAMPQSADRGNSPIPSGTEVMPRSAESAEEEDLWMEMEI